MFRTVCTGLLLVPLIAAGCVAAGGDRGQRAPTSGEVRFELAGPGGAALVVPVHVNGAGPFRFVLDTGATLTCVDESLAQELDLPPAAGVVGVGGTLEGVGAMRLLQLDTVALGEATVSNLRGCAVNLAPVNKAGLNVRGLLGLNFLRSYRLTIDFPRNAISIEHPEQSK